MQKINDVNPSPELGNCKDCGAFILDVMIGLCNQCLDPYYLEEHHGG